MSLYKNERVIDDANFPQFASSLVGDGVEVNAAGELRMLSAMERKAPYGSVSTPFEFSGLPLIPRSEWSARLKEQKERRARVSDYCDFPAYNQASTNYCWANGPCQAATTKRRIQGLPYVQFSAASIAAPIKGYRNQGGWGEDACEYLAKNGACRTELWPNAEINRARDNAESQADRLNFKVLEWIDCPTAKMFDYVVSACILSLPGAAAYSWWGHLVMGSDAVEIEANSFGLRIRNSWGAWGAKNEFGEFGFEVYREGKGTPGSYQILHQVTPSFALAA